MKSFHFYLRRKSVEKYVVRKINLFLSIWENRIWQVNLLLQQAENK